MLAEGTLGHLTQAALDYFDLHGSLPVRWELGVKEVWEVEKPLDRVIHTMGWPLRKRAKWNEFGGSFIYPMGEDKLCIGLVIGLDYTDSTLSCHDLLQELKTHPFVAKLLAGRQARRLGREDDPLRRLLLDAAQPRGARDGDRRRRGEHGQRPDAEGHPLRDARRDLRGRGDLRGAQGRLGQPRRLRRAGAQVGDRQRPVRVAQHARAVLEGLLRRRRGGQRDDDHQGRCSRAASGSTSPTPRSRCPTAAPTSAIPKPDNELTFNKLDSVFLSGNATRDDAPNHVKIQSHVPRELAKTWVNLCPAQVYEIPDDQLENGAAEVDVHVTASNCVQCGAINAKGGRLTMPEGGDGPLYQEV